MDLHSLWLLLIAYQVKHFLCDYPLQTKFMLGKFKPGSEFVKPLAAHCTVHALATLIIAYVYLWSNDKPLNNLFFVCSIDFVLHFIMDRIKASPGLLGRFHPLSPTEYIDLINFEKREGADDQTREDKKNNTIFWWCLGLDQGVHHLTHYLIIFYLLNC